jgi:hypothetical protein
VTTPTPAGARVEVTLHLGETTIDLATRALVVAVVPTPRWGREAEVLAGVEAAARAGVDVVEVPAEPRLLGPAAASGAIPVTATIESAADATAAREAGASLLLVPPASLEDVVEAMDQSAEPELRRKTPPVAVLVPDAWGVLAARQRDATAVLPIAVDTLRLSAVDVVVETSLALTAGARLVRTQHIRQARRVVEVMRALVEARR